MINRPPRKKNKTLALVSSTSHIHVTNVANNAHCSVPGAAPEAEVEGSASEQVGAEKSKTSSDDGAANADKATDESPIAEGDTKAPPPEADASPDSSQSACKAPEETTISESSGSNEDKQSEEADFPPIDPAAGSDALAAQEGDTNLTVSR